MSDWLDDVPDAEVLPRFETLTSAPVSVPSGYACEHVSVTSLPGVIRGVESAWCACEMQPVFA